MKTFMLILSFTLFFVPSVIFSQNVSDYNTGKTILYFSSDGLSLNDYKSGKTILYARNLNIQDYKTGKTIFYLSSDKKYLNLYATGKAILALEEKSIKEYNSWETVWSVEDNGTSIKDYKSWKTIYSSNSELDPVKRCMVLIALQLIDKNGKVKKNGTDIASKTAEKKSGINLNSNGKLDVGSTVAAKWSDGKWYIGTITATEGNTYNVLFADGTKYQVTKSDIKPLYSTLSLKAGDKVLAVWSKGAKFYPGKVERVEKNGAIILWEDGSAPSLTEFSKILK